MALATHNTQFANGSYIADRDLFIKSHENSFLLDKNTASDVGKGLIHSDTSLAIGFGYDILVRSASTVRQNSNIYLLFYVAVKLSLIAYLVCTALKGRKEGLFKSLVKTNIAIYSCHCRCNISCFFYSNFQVGISDLEGLKLL